MTLRSQALLGLWWAFAAVGLFLVVGSAAAYWYSSGGGDSDILVNPLGIAVAASGEIFILEDTQRIKVFNPGGRAVRTWRVQTAQGMARMAFGADGSLDVASVRNEMHFRFQPTGALISAEHDPSAYNLLPNESLWRATGPDGSRFEIRESAVVRTSPAGVETVVVPGPPRMLSFFFSAAPRPILLVHGGVLLAIGIGLAVIRRSMRHEAAG